MNKITVTLDSVTYAIKLKKLLSRSKIKSRIIKLSDREKLGGCAHGVEFNEEYFFDAVVIMKENGINYSLYTKQR